jgi:uncharacterized protein (DUF1697 family)
MYAALLRGINVGRARQVAMADLRDIVESTGYQGARTLLRSGNVVFAAPLEDAVEVASTLERAIEARLSMRVHVVVRSAQELAAVVAANPLPHAAHDGAHLHVMFLALPLTAPERTALEPAQFLPDEVRLAEREIYVWYRAGMSGSKTAEQLARRVKSPATDRNWNTVAKLLSLAREP